jgi:outer membrane protein assembly factor BamD (BamD/ComL family)
MLRNLAVVTALIAASLLAFHELLQDHRLLRLMDSMTPTSWAPAVEGLLGQTYYACQNYEEAQACYSHIVEQHPDTPQFENASFMRLECARFTHRFSSAEMANECRLFLGRFPGSEHAAAVEALATKFEELAQDGLDFKKIPLREGVEQMRHFGG